MRLVIDNKDKNDKKSLTAYEYESYNRAEFDVNNLSERFKKRRFIKKIKSVMDTIERIRGEDGKPIMPVFISENLSVIYKRFGPYKSKEKIVKSRVSGIGIEPSSILNQMLGSSFQEYDFYRNWILIFGKYFASPIAEGWKFYYDYELQDSLQVGDDYCYKIAFFPKRPQDLAFQGTMWITKEDYAIKQINCRSGEKANINFIEKFSIQQELSRMPGGTWIASKNRLLVDVDEPTKNTAGMLAKFYTSNRNFLLNKPKPLEFYDVFVERAPDANKANDAYWNTVRHDSLTTTEKNIFKMIDTVRNLPVVRSYVEVANIAVNGYKRFGPVDLGPYIYTYTNNNVEGNRFRVGFRTNTSFSRKFTYRGYMAYGTNDQRFKYESHGEYLFSRKHWTVLGTRYREEMELLSIYDNSITTNNLFNAFARLGSITRGKPFYIKQSQTYFSSEFRRGYTIGASYDVRSFQYNPTYFDFAYYPSQGELASKSANFNTSDFNVELKVAPDENYIENQNSRISLGSYRWPIFTFKYTRGVKGLTGGDFTYNKYQFMAVQYLNLAVLGRARYAIDIGYIPNTLPYSLLRPHLGNQTVFFYQNAFNSMNFFEFVSDRWMQLSYQQHLEGFLFNSIPKVRSWNLRLVASGNMLFGGMSRANRDFATYSLQNGGRSALPFSTLDPRRPYAEVGYGVENIFRFVRIDFVHRLTYLSQPGIRPLKVQVSFQFQL
jgi:hypothetical protein